MGTAERGGERFRGDRRVVHDLLEQRAVRGLLFSQFLCSLRRGSVLERLQRAPRERATDEAHVALQQRRRRALCRDALHQRHRSRLLRAAAFVRGGFQRDARFFRTYSRSLESLPWGEKTRPAFKKRDAEVAFDGERGVAEGDAASFRGAELATDCRESKETRRARRLTQ